MADLVEIQRANPFGVRAYRTVAGLGRSLAHMLAGSEELSELPNVGKDLARKTQEKDLTDLGGAWGAKSGRKIKKIEPAEAATPSIGETKLVEAVGIESHA